MNYPQFTIDFYRKTIHDEEISFSEHRAVEYWCASQDTTIEEMIGDMANRFLWISPNGHWQIERMSDSSHYRGFRVRVVSDSHADYPTLWPSGVLAWDRPEAVPAYVQRQANRILIPLLSEDSRALQYLAVLS